MIAIQNLAFHYGDDADDAFRLYIPRLDIASGEKVAIIGPSGSGKTTLLSLLAGILLPTHGHITVHGTRLEPLRDAARRKFRIATIGLIFQDFALLDYLTVLDNILHPYRLNPALRLTAEVRAQAVALATQAGLREKLSRSSQQLSHGEKQRTAICRALVTRPSLLLADEALGNLDPHNKEHMLELLFQYVEARSATLIAVTHDHALLATFDRVIDVQQLSQLTAYAS